MCLYRGIFGKKLRVMGYSRVMGYALVLPANEVGGHQKPMGYFRGDCIAELFKNAVLSILST